MEKQIKLNSKVITNSHINLALNFCNKEAKVVEIIKVDRRVRVGKSAPINNFPDRVLYQIEFVNRKFGKLIVVRDMLDTL
jgi:hypothetical protein